MISISAISSPTHMNNKNKNKNKKNSEDSRNKEKLKMMKRIIRMITARVSIDNREERRREKKGMKRTIEKVKNGKECVE